MVTERLALLCVQSTADVNNKAQLTTGQSGLAINTVYIHINILFLHPIADSGTVILTIITFTHMCTFLLY